MNGVMVVDEVARESLRVDPNTAVVVVMVLGGGASIELARILPWSVAVFDTDTDETQEGASVVALGLRLLEEHRAMAHAAAALREAQVERDRWTGELVDSAHEWADDNNLCREFDRFMLRHGLPTRERDYEVTVSVTMCATVTISVTATSEEGARDGVDGDLIRERIGSRYGSLPDDLSIDDYEIDGVEFD